MFNMSLHHSNTGISMWAQQPRALELYCQHTDTKVRDSTSRYNIEFYRLVEGNGRNQGITYWKKEVVGMNINMLLRVYFCGL